MRSLNSTCVTARVSARVCAAAILATPPAAYRPRPAPRRSQGRQCRSLASHLLLGPSALPVAQLAGGETFHGPVHISHGLRSRELRACREVVEVLRIVAHDPLRFPCPLELDNPARIAMPR